MSDENQPNNEPSEMVPMIKYAISELLKRSSTMATITELSKKDFYEGFQDGFKDPSKVFDFKDDNGGSKSYEDMVNEIKGKLENVHLIGNSASKFTPVDKETKDKVNAKLQEECGQSGGVDVKTQDGGCGIPDFFSFKKDCNKIRDKNRSATCEEQNLLESAKSILTLPTLETCPKDYDSDEDKLTRKENQMKYWEGKYDKRKDKWEKRDERLKQKSKIEADIAAVKARRNELYEKNKNIKRSIPDTFKNKRKEDIVNTQMKKIKNNPKPEPLKSTYKKGGHFEESNKKSKKRKSNSNYVPRKKTRKSKKSQR